MSDFRILRPLDAMTDGMRRATRYVGHKDEADAVLLAEAALVLFDGGTVTLEGDDPARTFHAVEGDNDE